MKRLIGLLLFLSNPVLAQSYTVFLGETPVKIIKTTIKKKNTQALATGPKTFVHLHENETTALSAVKQYLQREGGTLLTLKHGGTRNIVFHLNHVRYEIDPNRIFTDRGIALTLKQYGTYSLAAHNTVSKLAHKIVRLIPQGKVIAVHNNREYSLKEYFPNQSMHKEAEAVNYLKESNSRNFYFVTQKNEYKRLKTLNFNVALQAESANDDGSLSYYLGKRNYINIEAAYGELKAQLRMLYHA